MTVIVPQNCQIDGSQDLYGIGVRIGIYAQWVATLLATLFDPKTESTYRIANLIIQCSVFLGLCTQSGSGNSVIGAVITQYLLFGSLSSLTGDGISHLSHFSGIFRILFYTAVSIYGCWFWFEGVDLMSQPGCPEIAFFALVTVHGWFRTLAKVVAVVGLVLCAFLASFSMYATFRRFRKGAHEAFRSEERTRPKVELALLVISMGLIGASIYLIEHLIIVNEIQSVGVDQISSVGQLIPLLAGGLACAFTLWKVVVHRLFMKKRCWFLFGYHL